MIYKNTFILFFFFMYTFSAKSQEIRFISSENKPILMHKSILSFSEILRDLFSDKEAYNTSLHVPIDFKCLLLLNNTLKILYTLPSSTIQNTKFNEIAPHLAPIIQYITFRDVIGLLKASNFLHSEILIHIYTHISAITLSRYSADELSIIMPLLKNILGADMIKEITDILVSNGEISSNELQNFGININSTSLKETLCTYYCYTNEEMQKFNALGFRIHNNAQNTLPISALPFYNFAA